MASLQTRSSETTAPFGAQPHGNDTGQHVACATYWPVGQMQAFTLSMASHGLCVSSAMMMGDRRYALEQLACAHTLDDDALRELAVSLFHRFEQQKI